MIADGTIVAAAWRVTSSVDCTRGRLLHRAGALVPGEPDDRLERRTT